MIAFLDASALVKRYIEEPGSEQLAALMSSETVAISRLSLIEVASAVCRRCREGDLETDQRDQVLAWLEADEAGLHIVEVGPEVTAAAKALLRRHSLRAADAVQLASCLVLRDGLGEPPKLVAFDERLVHVAAQEL